jgi:hypothetical protein
MEGVPRVSTVRTGFSNFTPFSLRHSSSFLTCSLTISMGFLVSSGVMIGSDIGDHSILDPDGLLLNKLSCENVEEDTVGDNRIRRDIS